MAIVSSRCEKAAVRTRRSEWSRDSGGSFGQVCVCQGPVLPAYLARLPLWPWKQRLGVRFRVRIQMAVLTVPIDLGIPL